MGVEAQMSVQVKKGLAALIVSTARLNLFSMLAQVSFGTDVYFCLHAGVDVVAGGLEPAGVVL
jgi:hypothetical protein